jgi:hypothetical protein
MAFDPGHPVGDDAASGAGREQPPHMLVRPAEPPPPLGHIADAEPLRDFRRELSSQRQLREAPRLGSLRATVRAWAGRVSGRADRRLVVALGRATDALADRCDSIVDRLESQEALTAEVTEAFGSDLAHLRAEVAHLRALASAAEHQRGG